MLLREAVVAVTAGVTVAVAAVEMGVGGWPLATVALGETWWCEQEQFDDVH